MYEKILSMKYQYCQHCQNLKCIVLFMFLFDFAIDFFYSGIPTCSIVAFVINS